MALTAKTLSTITYNTREFLERKLNELIDAHIIETYRAILHDQDILTSTGELKKLHWHVWIKPNKRIDTMKLAEEFIEVDPNNDKPLKSRGFQKSDPLHWLRYTIHDPTYLALHGDDNDGRHEYQLGDYLTNDPEGLEDDYLRSEIVCQPDKKQQRDLLADHIISSDMIITGDSLYTYAKAKGLIDGYFAYNGALLKIAHDHNITVDMDSHADENRLKDKIKIQQEEIAKRDKTIESLMLNDLKERVGAEALETEKESIWK